ncbi:hypothetical protein ACTFIW_005431 [Dictyostelium discoideum]
MFVSYSFFKYSNYYFYYLERLTKRIALSKNNLIFQRSSHISNKLEDTIVEKDTKEKMKDSFVNSDSDDSSLNPNEVNTLGMGRRKRNAYLLKSKVRRIYNDLPKSKRLVIRYLTLSVQTYVNVAPFGTPEGISVSSTVKNNDIDLLIIEKRINDSLKHLLLISSMLSSDSSNVDEELISYLAQSAIALSANAQASLSRVCRNNIAKEIYGSEVLLPIKIKDTPKIFDETETERVRKLAKSIRKNNEAKQWCLLKFNDTILRMPSIQRL